MNTNKKEKGWYEKIGDWLKDWWGVVVSVGALIAGFFIGRRNRGGTHVDIERLRQSIDQLGEELRSARETIEFLERENNKLDNETRELGEELRETERAYKLFKQYHSESGDDIAELRTIRGRLESVLQKYKERNKKSATNE